MWKEHFNSPKVTDEPLTEIIYNQQDIKLEPLTQDANVLQTKFMNRKSVCHDEISPEVWKTRKFDDQQLRCFNAVYNQNTIK